MVSDSSTTNKMIPIMVVALTVMAFFVGMLLGKVQMYEQGGTVGGNNPGTTAAPAAGEGVPGEPVIATVKLDDDPVLGDKNAPVTIVEFSDYECPFCKRHFDQTYAALKEKYIDTGKVKLVYRDLPLSFHDPLATKEAVAANCAREQGGDKKYFEYHDEIFKRTASNGNGLTDVNLDEIATDLKLNLNSFKTCLGDEKQTQEVKDDLAYASSVGASGTPTFYIGKSNGDSIEGEQLVGAQPQAAFDALIDKYLAE